LKILIETIQTNILNANICIYILVKKNVQSKLDE